MVSQTPARNKTPATSVSFLYRFAQEPETSYLYPASNAGGVEQITLVEPTKVKIQPSAKRAGKNRPRQLVNRPGYIYLPLMTDTEYQTLRNPQEVGWFSRGVEKLCHKIGRGSIPITVQIKALAKEAPVEVYQAPDYRVAFPLSDPHGVRQAAEPIADYLRRLGVRTTFRWAGDPDTEAHCDYQAIRQKRVLRLHLFAHLAVADFAKVWGDRRISDHLVSLCRPDGERQEPMIQQGRRLRCSRKVSNNPKAPPERWIPVPVIVTMNGRKFALEFDVFDTSAMLGEAGRSLKDFHECAGIAMDAKDTYTKEQKGRMLLQFIADRDREGLKAGAYNGFFPEDYSLMHDPLVRSTGYLDYARGDVETLYEAIVGLTKQFLAIYKSLGLEPYYSPPRPTTGSTVHDILRSAVLKRFEGAFGTNEGALTRKQIKLIESIGFKPAEARELSTAKNWTGLNAKVFGGRCVATAPTLLARINRPIADIDIGGAYPSSMQLQEFPIGRPMILGRAFDRNSKRNGYLTLRKFLDQYGSELLPSLWQVWISVENAKGNALALPTEQDFFPSWDAPVSFFEYDEGEEGVWLERTDTVRYYLNEITNTVFTSEDYDWLMKVASRELRTFILDNAKVKTAMFYPATSRHNSPKEFITAYEAYEKTKQKNTSKVKVKRGKSVTVDTTAEFDGWYSVNLGELLSKNLGKMRSVYKRLTKVYEVLRAGDVHTIEDLSKLKEGSRREVEDLLEGGYAGGFPSLIIDAYNLSKHPLDALFKLCGNTVYGVVVSRFFHLSNPLVGNNITARCRAMIWYYEKSCRAWNSITDGGLMELDRVLYTRGRGVINDKNTTLTTEANNRELHSLNLTSAPIGGFDRIAWEGDYLVFEKEGEEPRRFHKSNTGEGGYLDLVNKLVLEHVRSSFPDGIRILAPDSPFVFEAKGVVQDAAIHGAGNYFLRGGYHTAYKDDTNQVVKMRSYSKENHKRVLIPFFEQLLANPSKLDRSRYWEPFVTNTILKTGAFSEMFESYFRHTILEPGDTLYQARFFRELGISAFRFRNAKQAESWWSYHIAHRMVDQERSSVGQSFEGFFLDENGHLDYRRMVEAIQAAILRGKPGLGTASPPPHPQAANLQRIRKKLRQAAVRDPSVIVQNPAEADLDLETSTSYVRSMEALYGPLYIPDEEYFR